jgi:predicted MPP superfamily phosphohydrolase
MKFRRFSRRRFLLTALIGTPAAAVADARWIEPDWLKVRHLKLCDGTPTHRLVHFTDLHHKGDRDYAQTVVKTINSLSPDFVCFTGRRHRGGNVSAGSDRAPVRIKSPMYGIPGNHDYWSHASFDGLAKCFAASGGAWLEDDQRVIAGGRLNIIGIARQGPNYPFPPPQPGIRNILLMHYPAWVKRLQPGRFDLILAGHSHGGQVRIPFYGAIMVPFSVDEYDLGLFETEHGPMYVNPGIGWFPVPLRFNCRPEITVIEI